MQLQEEFLQMGWKTGLFMTDKAMLTDGRTVQILHRGHLNTGSGPDFLQAKIQIEDTLWMGNIEFHVNSSDWMKHRHQHDPAYESVILHVVWKNDLPIYTADGMAIPTLELHPLVSPVQLEKYQALLFSLQEIPCEHHLKKINSVTIYQMIQRAVIDRIERKTQRIYTLLEHVQQDWENVFYHMLFRNFGFRHNQHAFEALIQQLPYTLFDHLKDRPMSSEALLFGTAGLLSSGHQSSYLQSLLSEYEFLRHKHHLQPIHPSLWTFGRLRPANFPFVRLAQLSSILSHHNRLLSRVLEADDIQQLYLLFQSQISTYWIIHYKPDVSGKMKNNNLSKNSIDLIIINTCVPVVFAYGKASGQPELVDKALSWLEKIKPENNRVIRYWKKWGIIPQHCFDSQGLLELKEMYCQPKKCMECHIGYQLLRNP